MGGHENDPRRIDLNSDGVEASSALGAVGSNGRIECCLMFIELEEKTRLIDVAIPLPIKDPYTYRVPELLVNAVQVGSRVRVPFRNRSIVGYCVALDPTKEVKKPKDILEVIDPEPVVSDHLLRLARWISDYYFSSWGEAISNMVPKYLKQSAEKSQLDATAEIEESLPLRLNEEQREASQKLTTHIQKNEFHEI